MVAPTPSKLDERQILQNVHDEATGTLRTTAAATIVNADIDVALDATEDNVAIRDAAGHELNVNPDGSINTVVTGNLDVEISAADGDNIAIISSTGTELKINPTGSIDVVEGVKTGGVYGAMSMPTAGTAYEVKVGASALANRKVVYVTATTTGIYWGTDNLVTIATGTPLMNNQVLTITTDPNSSFKVFLVSASNNRTARVVEIP